MTFCLSETAHTASGILNDCILFERPYVSDPSFICRSRLIMSHYGWSEDRARYHSLPLSVPTCGSLISVPSEWTKW